MRWLADECVSATLVASLRAAGHDVRYIAEVAPGMRDAEVIAQASADERLLLTEDKDFGELTVRLGHNVPGLVLIRIDPVNPTMQAARLNDAIARYGAELFGRYVVIEQARMRVRELRNDGTT
jgi:predicted nuclease of predicted toxin-antitoxin system